MLSFKLYLDEVFNKTYSYTFKVKEEEWDDDAEDVIPVRYQGSFKTKDNGIIEVSIVYLEHPLKHWHIDFKKNGELDATKEGDEFAIISTVLQIIKDFIQEEKPKTIIFEAGKSGRGQRNTETRVNLYKTLVKKFSGSVGYNYTVKDESGIAYFILTKK